MSTTKRDQFRYKITSCDFIKALGLSGTWVKELKLTPRSFVEDGKTLNGKIVTITTTSKTKALGKSKSKSKKRKTKRR